MESLITLNSSPGQIAYEAYCDCRNWKSYDRMPLPRWDKVDGPIKAAWEAAARRVIETTSAELWERTRKQNE